MFEASLGIHLGYHLCGILKYHAHLEPCHQGAASYRSAYYQHTYHLVSLIILVSAAPPTI